mmetsp:Transcript_13678/g.28261  ORF Transcript_13678/g.28261 Transcript_13678/m.28261 type:complete len:256 (-) Transcript_13678:99-866(-)
MLGLMRSAVAAGAPARHLSRATAPTQKPLIQSAVIAVNNNGSLLEEPTQFSVRHFGRWTKRKIKRENRRKRREEWAKIGKEVPKPPRWKDVKTPVVNAVPREEQDRIRENRRTQNHLSLPKPQTNPNVPDGLPKLLLPFHRSVFETEKSLKISPRVAQLLALSNGNQRRVVQAQKEAGMKLFEKRPGDTGSSAVQIIALTARIQQMQTHMIMHPKDKSGKRGLQVFITKRRKMLDYLEREDFEEYAKLSQTLGLA